MKLNELFNGDSVLLTNSLVSQLTLRELILRSTSHKLLISVADIPSVCASIMTLLTLTNRFSIPLVEVVFILRMMAC